MKYTHIIKASGLKRTREELLAMQKLATGPLVTALKIENKDWGATFSRCSDNDQTVAFSAITSAIHDFYQTQIDRVTADLEALGVTFDDEVQQPSDQRPPR